MTRLLMIAAGIALVITVITAVRTDPHLWGRALSLLDHEARGAGTQISARLGTWVTPGPGSTP
jgi:hypothetical protein